MTLSTHQVLRLCGLRNPKSIYAHVLKGNLTGRKRSRSDGGLAEWVFDETEAQRFAEWIKTTPPRRR